MLIKRYRKKLIAEERSTGLSPELTELGQALADVVEMEDVASTPQEIDETVRKEKEDTVSTSNSDVPQEQNNCLFLKSIFLIYTW